MVKVKSIREVGKFVRRAIKVADDRYYTSMARAIEELVHCRIRLVPTKDRHFRKQARTISRVVEMKLDWPTRKTFRRPEHWIFFAKTPKALAARCIAHELFHVFAHDPTTGDRPVTPDKFKLVVYDVMEERDADIFSLILLRCRSFAKGSSIPNSARGFLKLLRTEAGMPAYLTEDEVERVARFLYEDTEWGGP